MDFEIFNFATFVNTYGTASIVDGRYIKSLNQWCNKKNARKDLQKNIFDEIFVVFSYYASFSSREHPNEQNEYVDE
jgi:hypothetical protein